jgi:hypothetical protein
VAADAEPTSTPPTAAATAASAHVARIRRRLGAESRSEMLSMLRALIAVDESPASANLRA